MGRQPAAQFRLPAFGRGSCPFSPDAFEQGGGGFFVFGLFYQLTVESLFQDGLAQRVGLLQRGGEGLVELVGFGEFGFDLLNDFLLLMQTRKRDIYRTNIFEIQARFAGAVGHIR